MKLNWKKRSEEYITKRIFEIGHSVTVGSNSVFEAEYKGHKFVLTRSWKETLKLELYGGKCYLYSMYIDIPETALHTSINRMMDWIDAGFLE